MDASDEIINDLGQIEISHSGLIHFMRALRDEEDDAKWNESELVAMSFLVSHAALDADMGIAVGYALPHKNTYRLLGISPDLPAAGKIPPDILPFELHDAPCYKSCNFFNWVGYPPTANKYLDKIRRSLEKFRQFAGIIVQQELVESVEFRFTEYDEYGVEMMKVVCPVGDMVERVMEKISDPEDVPAMQVVVTR